MLEKNIETDIKKWLSKQGYYFFKVHGSSFMLPGIPDIVCCINGFFVGIEVKNKGKLYNQSEQQKIHEQLIIKNKGVYILADSLKTVQEKLCKLEII